MKALLPEVSAHYDLKKGQQVTKIVTRPFGFHKTRVEIDLSTVTLKRIKELLSQGAELPLIEKKKTASKDA